MPVLIDRGSDRRFVHAAGDFVDIALVNNMPDSALEATERQFISLIEAGAQDIRVRLRFFSLPGVPRGERGQRHVDKSYRDLRELFDSRLDALIVTGTEPRAASLRDEPYWRPLTELIDWAEHHTVSTIWSCLAAHAAVLHLDGIARHPLAEKCFGVFDCAPAVEHPLIAGARRLGVPHSRWNGLREDELVAGGYEVLTRSAQAGVDIFAKQGRSLFVFWQGHPEYDAASLLGEYRRDLGRFLRRERETCPAMPHGYFDAVTTAELGVLRARALLDRRADLLDEFPLAAAERGVRAGWRPAAERLFGNWLIEVAACKARRRYLSDLAPRATRPAALPFIERRRQNDPAGYFSGPRDRRAATQP
jgi:homoserine O-succinyltransferase/O-acetyltransferase